MSSKYIYKCPFCEKKYVASNPDKRTAAKRSLYDHMEENHKESLDGMSPAQVYFNKKYNKTHGTCVICHKETKWNEKNERYDRFCSQECKEKYRQQFLERMQKRPDWNLNDPDVQKKMLSNRKISGQYLWSDKKTKTNYVCSYEKDFLEFLDIVMEWDPKDVMSPAPQIFKYTYNGKEHFYIPDFYLCNLNVIIEIKDGGDNPNMHHKIQEVDKEKERLKDQVMNKQKGVYYIKVVDKDYSIFLNKLLAIKASS